MKKINVSMKKQKIIAMNYIDSTLTTTYNKQHETGFNRRFALFFVSLHRKIILSVSFLSCRWRFLPCKREKRKV